MWREVFARCGGSVPEELGGIHLEALGELAEHMGAHTGGMPRSLQIFWASLLAISEWRGTAEVSRVVELRQMLCRVPSRSSPHPWRFMCRSSWRRFKG